MHLLVLVTNNKSCDTTVETNASNLNVAPGNTAPKSAMFSGPPAVTGVSSTVPTGEEEHYSTPEGSFENVAQPPTL